MTKWRVSAGLGPHAAFIKSRLPGWIRHSRVVDVQRLKQGLLARPRAEDAQAPLWLRESLAGCQARSRQANQALARTLKDLQGITQFAEPRLKEALHSHSAPGVEIDVNKNRLFYLRRDQPVQHQSLLQAALLNFEGNEEFSLMVNGQVSALAPEGALAVDKWVPESATDIYSQLADTLVHGTGEVVGEFEQTRKNLRPVPGFEYREKLAMTPEVFSRLCRALDLGQQYQEHLYQVFEAPDKAPRVSYQMIRAQKELLGVRQNIALMQKDISLHAYDMLQAVLDRAPAPKLNGQPVVFSQLQLYGFTLGEILLIGPYRSTLPVMEWAGSRLGFEMPVMKKPDMEPLLVYIPGAPLYPLKEYPSLEAFQYELGLNLRTEEYQQLFASLVPEGQAQTFLARLNAQLYKTRPDPATGQAAVYVDEVDLRLGQRYLDTPPAALFEALHRLHVQRLKGNARLLAVPTADADSQLLQQRLDYYLGLGMDAVNVAAFFVPGLGEVMMAVMALQIGMEVYHGIESWGVGDLEGAWAHCESVAINLAVAGVVAGAGHGISNVAGGTLARWGDQLIPIKLRDGQTRLWKPDLNPYQCDPRLPAQLKPNALGQYEVQGRLYVQVDQQFYELTSDQALNEWRIRHPTDDKAYQPELRHNNAGAWRHSHEQPLQWQRQTLLRRLGFMTRGFDDATLAQMADVCGVGDDALRKVHVDGLLPPALLLDTLEQYWVERELGQLQPSRNRHLADKLRTEQKALFRSLTQSGEQEDARVEGLCRRFPLLSERTAREVLAQAGPAALTSGTLDDLARAAAQQCRLSRALAGLYLPGLASADSERLAAHCREIPGVGQGTEGRYATSHRREMARVLKLREPRARPDLQWLNGQIGYALSGRGDAFDVDPSLLSRMRTIYPNMTDEVVSRYLYERQSGGESSQHLFHFLANQERELGQLRATLEHWQHSGNQWERQPVVDRVIACWREGLQRTQEPFACLDFGSVGDFPVLDADFSHVRALKLDADLMLSEPEAGFVKRFPTVQRLELSDIRERLMAVVEALAQLPGIKELSLYAGYPGFTQAFMSRLSSMEQLEQLTLLGSLDELDVSAWPGLRVLRLSGHLQQWPAGVFGLEHLQALDLFGTSIRTLPDELFTEPRSLWRSLRLDWSSIDPPMVIKAFDYLRDEPAHLVDLDQWMAQYCQGCLRQFGHLGQYSFDEVFARSSLRGQGLPELFRQINALHAEHQALMGVVEAWVNKRPLSADMFFRRLLADKVQHCWRAGITLRLGVDEPVAGPAWRRPSNRGVLDLSDGVVSDLPQLPASGFSHVEHLDMSNLNVPPDEINGFIGLFSNIRRLNLSRNNLIALPPALSELRQITELNLAFNELTVNPSTQGCLNRMGELRNLNLQRNRVTSLDVRMLPRLQVLNLSETCIREWPAGVLQLTSLRQLNLARSAITGVPQAALTGHEQLLAGTYLSGCLLSPASCAELLAYAQRTGHDNVAGIDVGLLAQGKTGGTPEYFPQSVSDNPELLLADLPQLSPGEVQLTPAALLQRLNPDLTLAEAIAGIDGMQANMGAQELAARLAQWAAQQGELIHRLNNWIDTPGYREGGRWVSALDRRRAADRIMGSWRQALAGVRGQGSHALDFSDLCLGDIPALPVTLEHITTLNLNGVRLGGEGTVAFIADCPALNTLQLSNNGLTRLPEVVGWLASLNRLEASYNGLEDSEQLHRQLQTLPRLEWLDLSHNRLERFDLTGLNQLHTLDLSGNRLVQWPSNALNTPTLRTMNLSNNLIEYIPTALFDGNNDRLMADTDVSDNLLSSSGYRTLRDYMDFSGNGLGFTREEIEMALLDSDESDSSFGAMDEDLENAISEPEEEQKARWFEGVAHDSPKHGIWSGLQAQEGSESLFHLLSELKHSRDFIQDRADLARRVWEVLQAIESDAGLRSDVFTRARSQYTCGDGRILLFSNIEVKVYEFNVLKSVVAGEEGAALLKLSRGLFRLGQVEEIAQVQVNRRPRIDPAEIRMAYRVDLAKRLDLPRQPQDMLYRNVAKVSAEDLEAAYVAVLAAENTPAYLEQLLAREYWVDYLKRKYPQEFAQMEQARQEQADELEDRHPDFGAAYSIEVEALGKKNTREERELLVRLTERERAEIEHL